MSKKIPTKFEIPKTLDTNFYINTQNKEYISKFIKGENIIYPLYNSFNLVVYYIFKAIIDLFEIISLFLGKTIPSFVSTFNILLVHLLFFLFLYTLGYLIMYNKFPSYDFLVGKSSNNGNNISSINKDKKNENENDFFKYYYDYFGNTGNKFLSNISTIFGSFEPQEYITREKTIEGRCDEIDNVTYNNTCISSIKKENLLWNLNGQSDDYTKLPPELKDINKEQIEIPFKKHSSGVYIPDCSHSIYSKTKKKTNLLRTINNNTCSYNITSPYIVKGIKFNDGPNIGNYL
jgi:hypothetical protein